MALKTVDTEHFGDVELKLKECAQTVEGLKADFNRACGNAEKSWTGEGHDAFQDLAARAEMEMSDISDEFWAAHEALCEAEGLFLEADAKVGTKMRSS